MWATIFVLGFVVLGVGTVVVAMRSGSKGPVLDPSKRSSRKTLAALTALVVLACGAAIPVAVGLAEATQEEEAGPVDLAANEVKGRQVFNQSCVQCHALGASNAVQRIGPNLDDLRPPKALVLDAIEKGRARGNGQMPALLVTGQDADDVAAYIAKVAGRAP